MDGTVHSARKTTTLGFPIPSLGIDFSGRINITTSSAMAEYWHSDVRLRNSYCTPFVGPGVVTRDPMRLCSNFKTRIILNHLCWSLSSFANLSRMLVRLSPSTEFYNTSVSVVMNGLTLWLQLPMQQMHRFSLKPRIFRNRMLRNHPDGNVVHGCSPVPVRSCNLTTGTQGFLPSRSLGECHHFEDRTKHSIE